MQTYDPHKNTTDVRQGDRRMTNMRVLLFSLCTIVVLFALLYFLFFMNTPPTAQ